VRSSPGPGSVNGSPTPSSSSVSSRSLNIAESKESSLFDNSGFSSRGGGDGGGTW
jgi:hypothetical protein